MNTRMSFISRLKYITMGLHGTDAQMIAITSLLRQTRCYFALI